MSKHNNCLFITGDEAKQEWKRIRDHFVRLNKRRKQVSSGAPSIDVLDTEENCFMQNLSWLTLYINRKKRFKSKNFWNVSVTTWCVIFHLEVLQAMHCIHNLFCRVTSGNFGPGNVEQQQDDNGEDNSLDNDGDNLEETETSQDEDDIPVHQLFRTDKAVAPPLLKKKKQGVSDMLEEKESQPKLKFNFASEQQNKSGNETNQGVKAAFKPPAPAAGNNQIQSEKKVQNKSWNFA